ncbi:MAG: hypothetical protein K0S55_1157 [Clostridia bacterium]|nr:hypothetical protein [Clostridia bacterium]
MFIYPRSLRIETTRAQLLLNIIPAKMDIKTEKKGLSIKSNPIKLEIDNRSFFDSMGLKSLKELARDNIALGKNAVIEAMQRYADQKNAMSGPNKISIGKIQLLRVQRPIQHMMTFIPSEKPSMDWSGGNVDISYEKDITDITWIPATVEAEYIPYKIKMFIDEWVQVPKEAEKKII